MDRDQQPLDTQSKSPTLPMGRSPTPPFSPGRKAGPTPIQRFNDMQTSPSALTPDGRPATLPGAGSRYFRGVAQSVVTGRPTVARQRFSGSGLLPQTQTERRERRARTMTLALASAAVLLILGSALLLFQPTILWPGFGFKLGQQFSRLASNIPLIIQGTPPPVTPTPRASPGVGTPTPSSHGGSGGSSTPTATAAPTSTAPTVPTATPAPLPTTTLVPTPTPVPQPTATLVPTPTPVPTSTPTVLPTGATVTFTSVPSQSETSNGSMNACPSGCDLPTQSTSGQVQGQQFKQYVSGYQSTEMGGTIHVTVTSLQACSLEGTYHCYSWSSWTGGNVIVTNSGFSSCKVFYLPPAGPGSSFSGLGFCTYDTSYDPLSADSVSGTGAGSYTINGGEQSIQVGVHIYNDYWTQSENGWYYPTQGDCNTAIYGGNGLNGAYYYANSNARSAINSWSGGELDVQPSISQAGGAYCNPNVGQPGGSVTGYAFDNYSASGYAASCSAQVPVCAQSVASARINALLPQGYYWSVLPSTCSPSGGSWSGNEILNIQCSDSGTASYDWRSGSTAQANLKQSLEGQSNTNALAICNSFPGVQPGTCSITYQGGNVQTMPSSPSAIQINVQ